MIVFKISTDMLTVVMTKTEMLLILCVGDYTERLDEFGRFGNGDGFDGEERQYKNNF